MKTPPDTGCRRGKPALPARGMVWLMPLVAMLPACTPGLYHTLADRETKLILGSKAAKVENIEGDLSIEPPAPADLEKMKKRMQDADFLGKERGREKGARVLPLDDALAQAVRLNRTYRGRKETLYLQALELTGARHEFTPIFHGTTDLAVKSDSRTGEDVSNQPAPVAEVGGEAGTATVQRTIDGIVATNTQTRTSSMGFTLLQRAGARLAVDFTEDFLGFVTGSRNVSNSALAVTLTQPILKGGGYMATMENLTQAEREMLYSLRDFSNYRREFVVGIAERYYNILRARDEVRNNWVSYQGFLKVVESEEAMSQEGLRTLTQLGLLRQAALRAESFWVRSVLDYEAQLDAFKVELVLPLDEAIVLDEGELKKLGIEDAGLTREQAVKVAQSSRPDLVTARDRVEDAERKIEVAKVGLRPGLDVNVGYDVVNPPGVNRPQLDFRRRNLSSGVTVDLPVNRKLERNTYQATLVGLERARRDETLAQDEVALQIRDDWRAIEQARRGYEIAAQGVALAERRLEEQRLLFEINKGEARDLVEAQTDLVESLNERTSAIISHSVARLRLWRDMGILFISKEGQWHKKLKEEGHD